MRGAGLTGGFSIRLGSAAVLLAGISVLLLALAVAMPPTALGKGEKSAQDLIKRLKALDDSNPKESDPTKKTGIDVTIMKLQKGLIESGTFAFERELDGLHTEKEKIAADFLEKEALGGKNKTFGVAMPTIFTAIDCADRELAKAGLEAAANHSSSQANAVAALEASKKCLDDLIKELNLHPPEKGKVLDPVSRKVGKAIDDLNSGKLALGDVKKRAKEIAKEKEGAVTSVQLWDPKGREVYGIPFGTLILKLSEIDVSMVRARYATNNIKAANALGTAKIAKDELIEELKKANKKP